MAAHLRSLVCLLCILIKSVVIEASLNKIPLEKATIESFPAERQSRDDDLLTRVRRAAESDVRKTKEDLLKEEYERRLYESRNFIGSVQPTRLYVPEYIHPSPKSFNFEIGAQLGRVRKLFPYGKQKIVWPYVGQRVVHLDEDTGDVRIIAKTDYEKTRSYNLTIRDFRHDYTDPDPVRMPPVPYPRSSGDPRQDYVDHYLFIEVVDRNDNEPKIRADVTPSVLLSGIVNSNARAGTPVLYISPDDEDTGLRGTTRFNIKTENNTHSGFTIDPKAHYLKTTGTELATGVHTVQIEALDYGSPPKSSYFYSYTVRVGRNPPEFVGTPYNHNFSEASVRGGVVTRVQAISRSGAPLKYEILTEDAKNTFAINHLGELTLLRVIDYDTANDSDKLFSFVIRAIDQTYAGHTRDVDVNLKLVNVDDHVGMIKKPAKRLELQERDYRTGDEIYKVDVEDCDCARNCSPCQLEEVVYSIGDTGGLFEITNEGQIVIAKDLSLREKNYFCFPVFVKDRAVNGRTTTSYLEVIIEDVESPPKFAQTNYNFTIYEDAWKDQVVGVVQAISPDSKTEPDDIKYAIMWANPLAARGYFTVEKHGIIKISKNNDQLIGSDSYELIITAHDKSNQRSDSPVFVTISVLGVNDHKPVFRNCKERSIDENQPINTLLTSLIAIDEDRGIHKEIEYSLVPLSGHNFFKIDSNSGEVRTTQVLDREQQDEIFVIAKAADNPGKFSLLRQVSYCQFVVKVLDVNDNHPTFSVRSFEVKVLRSLPKGASVLRVEAEDPDLGANGEIEYRILTQHVGQRPGNYLEIVQGTGEVRVKNSMLTLELREEITLVIKADNKEKVIGSVSDPESETTVRVKFSTKAPPKFNQTKYTVDVPENSTAGTTVLTLTPDVDENVMYFLQTIRHRDDLPFFIEATTGKIKTLKVFYFKQKSSYIFAVAAKRRGDDAITSILVQVNVVKLGHSAPAFGRDRFSASVSEAAGGGVDVFRIQAFDLNSANCSMVYEIEEEHDFRSFSLINMKTFAQIKTANGLRKGSFDREKRDYYTLVITAYKQCLPSLKTSVLLEIQVVDENDSPPVFTKDYYEGGPIPESVPVPYTVPDLVLEARDEDLFADLRYYITSGNDGRFSMETVVGQFHVNTGRLVITSPLNVKKSPEFERNPKYTLTVTATDGKHTATATIFLRLLADSKPEFLEPYYETNVTENTGPGHEVVQVGIKERPVKYNSTVRYRLDKKAMPYFAIDEDTGVIMTAGELLNWNVMPVMTFPVYAYEDRFPNITAVTFVRVLVNDANEPPTFPDQPYVGYIKENLPAGSFVRYINAMDPDNPEISDGRNVKLTYELVTDSGDAPFDDDGKLFDLESDGKLLTKVKLDAEEFRRNLSIRIRAWDHGTPRLSRKTDVTIVILDESEFAPSFAQREYEANVSETSLPGTVVVKLTTKDEDFAAPNSYAFSLLSGNYPYAFDINQETGEIVVSGFLDFDTKSNSVYKLTVGLKERSDELLIKSGISVKSRKTFEDTATVTITITEGNDNRPTFTKEDKMYSTVIPEGMPPGTTIDLGIEVEDLDRGFSDQFRFFIKSGNPRDYFAVKQREDNPKKALLTIRYPPDREFQDLYTMQLVVMDEGGISDMAWLRVTLADKNDMSPRFLSPYYTATIMEGPCDTNTSLVHLKATDDDLDQANTEFTIVPGSNPNNLFQLRDTNNTSTNLYCSGTIDRETTPDLKVVIQARDKAHPKPYLLGAWQSYSRANVFIHVADKDEFPVSSGSLRVFVNAVNGWVNFGPIAKTYFQDKDDDANDGMTYVLASGSDRFFVDRHSGWIFAKYGTKVGDYKLEIAGQKGSLTPTCAVNVTIRDVPSEAIANSAAIQFYNVLDANRFLNPISNGLASNFDSISCYERFVNTLAEIFDVPKEDIYVFSVQMSNQTKLRMPYPAIDVHFAVRKNSAVKSPFLPKTVLINTIEKSNETLKTIGFEIGRIGLDYCEQETVKSGMCRNVIRYVDDEYSVVSSDYGLLPVPDYAVAITSITVVVDSEYDRYHQDPDPEFDECNAVSCLNGGICHDIVPRGFVCECHGLYNGPRCQLTTRTFLGDSYVWLPPTTPHNFGSVSLEFSTSSVSGLLLYQGPALNGSNNGRRDFLSISLNNGRIQVGVSFGGEPQVIKMEKGPTLNDRDWHHVEVLQQRKEVTITIDHCKHAEIVENDGKIVEKRENCEVVFKTTRDYEFLNGMSPVQVGGIENMPLEYPSSKYVVYKHFEGCIRNIKENLEIYDLATPLKVVNAPTGCTDMAPCPKCSNGGYCSPGFPRSICTCSAGFVGEDCSDNSPRNSYQASSYSTYTLPGKANEKADGLQHSSDFLDRFRNQISMQLRLDPGVTRTPLFLAVSEDGKEYSRLRYENQKLYCELKLLDAMVFLEMPSLVNIADGNWHQVTVTREGNYVVLQVDHIGKVSRNTGGVKRLMRMSGGKIVVGGMAPNITFSKTTADKEVKASFNDRRYLSRRSAEKKTKAVESIDSDLQGCISSIRFNGRNLDTDPSVKKTRVNVEASCPCRRELRCENGGTCVDGPVPFCQCPKGWSGISCGDEVTSTTAAVTAPTATSAKTTTKTRTTTSTQPKGSSIANVANALTFLVACYFAIVSAFCR